MREARNRFANLVKEAFAKAGRDPIDFASEFKTAERREGFYALLAGDETPFAHHIAKAIAWRMSNSFDAELWATTFHEAYPSPDFKPMLIGANPELGMQVVMVIPDEADAMRLLEAMAANPDRRSKLIHVCLSPSLLYGGDKTGEHYWSFNPDFHAPPERAFYPVELGVRPPEATTPFWFGQAAGHTLVACTPEKAWFFERVEPPIPEHCKPAGPPLKMEEHIEEVQALLDWLNAHMEEHGAAVSRRGDLEIKKTFLERKLLDSYPEPLTEQERVICRKALENVSAELSRTESIIGEFRERNRELGRYGLANIPFWLAEELVWMEMKKQKGGKE